MGGIQIDGQDIRQVTLASIRDSIGYVFQETYLFSDTVARNIAYADKDAPLSHIKEAAHIARADEFIERLPDKYNQLIGEYGATLSGGQKQRLAIARAILHNPRILVLDDSLSAVDPGNRRIDSRRAGTDHERPHRFSDHQPHFDFTPGGLDHRSGERPHYADGHARPTLARRERILSLRWRARSSATMAPSSRCRTWIACSARAVGESSRRVEEVRNSIVKIIVNVAVTVPSHSLPAAARSGLFQRHISTGRAGRSLRSLSLPMASITSADAGSKGGALAARIMSRNSIRSRGFRFLSCLKSSIN